MASLAVRAGGALEQSHLLSKRQAVLPFVAQSQLERVSQDALFALSTVAETLMFSAQLRFAIRGMLP